MAWKNEVNLQILEPSKESFNLQSLITPFTDLLCVAPFEPLIEGFFALPK